MSELQPVAREAPREPCANTVSADTVPADQVPAARWHLRGVSPDRLADYAALIFVALMAAAFSAGMPGKFATVNNLENVVSDNAISGILAIAALFPLACGEFDLSVAANLGICSVFSAHLASTGTPLPFIIILTLLVGTVIGIVNAFFVVLLRVNSFIATLGLATALAGGNLAITGGQTIYQGISTSVTDVATASVGGFQVVTIYFAVIALAAWYVLERTPYGRYLRASGFGRTAARLSGISTGRYVAGSLVIAGFIAGLCGFLQTAEYGSATPTVGPSFLLPAYAAAFLGTTTIRRGAFNVWGTVVGVALLAVGINGLALAGTPSWLSQVFDGAALLAAVSFAALVSRRLGSRT
jgi:ribose transport system permease protein